MKWTPDFLKETSATLERLGLADCSVCGGRTLERDDRPYIVGVGGVRGSELEDQDTNIVYFLRISCDTCGHVLLFDSEKFRDGDAPVLQQGRPR